MIEDISRNNLKAIEELEGYEESTYQQLAKLYLQSAQKLIELLLKTKPKLREIPYSKAQEIIGLLDTLYFDKDQIEENAFIVGKIKTILESENE